MSFEKLIDKVSQAEAAMEAHERQVGADLRQLRRSWTDAWTPGRVVMAGLVAGFLTGRAEPLGNAARGGSVVRIVSLLSGLFASTAASHAADQAEQAATTSEDVADAVAPGAGRFTGDAPVAHSAEVDEQLAHERLLRAAEAARRANGEASGR